MFGNTAKEEACVDSEAQSLADRGLITKWRRKRTDGQTEVDDVALRFYLAIESDDDVRHDVKSVRLRRQTTVEDILPTLREKFQLQVLPSDIEVYAVTDLGELPLGLPVRPLDVVLQSEAAPRLVVRVANGDMKSGAKRRLQGTICNYKTCYGRPSRVAGREAPINERLTGKSGNRAPSDSEHDSDECHTTLTPDLVGDCRRRPIIPGFDCKSIDVRPIAEWLRPSRSAMLGSDSNLNVVSDAGTSDVSFGFANDSAASDSERGRKKTKSRWRSRSRNASADSVSTRHDDHFKRTKRASSLRSSLSKTGVFQKRFSLRKKDESFQHKTELSTEESSPGILKIFGDSITPGANYKSVLAVTTSTSRELIKEALERYGIPKRKSEHYVLCDVIGHFMNYSSDLEPDDEKYSLSPDNGLWTEQCIRIIGDNERPLVLQKFWKPSEGYARRFELRRRSDLLIIEDKDTSGVNANVRRLLTSKVKCESGASSVDSQSELDSVQGCTDEEVTSRKFARDTRQHWRADAQHRTGKDRHEERAVKVKTPNTCPFLVNVHGYNPSQDCVVYPISHRCVKVGSDRKLMAKNIFLTAPDILLKHCELRLLLKGRDNGGWKNDGDERAVVSLRVQIHIHPGADVRINGKPKTNRTELQNGDIINFGQFYQFVYRDPYAPRSVAPSATHYGPRMDTKNGQTSGQANAFSPPQITPGDKCSASEIENSALRWRLNRSVDYDNDRAKNKLVYSVEREDELLQTIVDMSAERSNLYPLTPAYLLSMAVDFSAAKHEQLCTRTLLLKLATKIHNSVLRRARTLAEKQASQPSDPYAATEQLLTDLSPIISWMVNALELLNHFRRHMTDYLLDSQLYLTSHTRASVATAGDEVIGTLEEVVMYTFQQTVYYLTKALYTSLPAITEGNPFQDDSRTDTLTGRPTMNHVITVYQTTLEYLRDYRLHSSVVSQLFCYLFFFTSTSVFNNLMSKDCAGKYFQWARGVQLRGNLYNLEAWAAKNGFKQEASVYLKKLVNLANLLSTPKAQLIKASWSTLRAMFPDLNPTQLHHVLSNYEDGGFSQTWQPTIDDAEHIHSNEITESFNGHPPLCLPTDGFLLDLNSPVDDPEFYKILNDINTRFVVSDDDVDSGLSISQNCSSNEFPRQTSNDEDSRDVQQTLNRTYVTDQFSSDVCTSGHASGRRRDLPKSAELERSDSTPYRRSSSNNKIERPSNVRAISFSTTRRKTSPTENRRFRPIETVAIGVSGHSSADGNRNEASPRNGYSYNTEQSLSFSDRRTDNKTTRGNYTAPAKSTNHVADDSISQTFTSENVSLTSTSFSCSDQKEFSKHTTAQPTQSKYPPGSLPSGKGRESSGSLNSSISSQISREGIEVYQYMKETINVLDGETDAHHASLHPGTRDDSHGNDTTQEAMTISVNVSKGYQNTRTNATNRPLQNKNELKGGYRAEDMQSLDVTHSVPSCHSSSLLATIHSRHNTLAEDTFIIELPRGPMGFGMGLIDGMHTPLHQPGIYVRTIVAGSPAQLDGHLRLGDRILAVNGSSVIGVDYASAMQAIKDAGEKIRLKAIHTDSSIVMSVTASPC